MSTLICPEVLPLLTDRPSLGLRGASSADSAVRLHVVEQAKRDLECGLFDDPEAINQKIEACLDAVLADVLPNTPLKVW